MSPATRQRPFGSVEEARRGAQRLVLLVAAGVAVGLVVWVGHRLAPPAVIPRLVLDNSSGYDFEIEVTDVAHDGWMPVGSAARHRATEIDAVVDQGSVWVFRFSAQRSTTREFYVNREALRRQRWHVAIPHWVDSELTGRGVQPPP